MRPAAQSRESLLASLVPGVVASTFERMAIAEEEIAAAIRRHPSKRAELHAAFGQLCPSEPLRGLDPAVYRHHCCELLVRVARGEPTGPGTAAEALALLSAASLSAPPGQQAAALMDELFANVMGARLPGRRVREPWPGASAELLRDIRRRLTVVRGAEL